MMKYILDDYGVYLDDYGAYSRTIMEYIQWSVYKDDYGGGDGEDSGPDPGAN